MSKSRVETYGSAIDLLALDTDGAMKKVARSVAGAGLLSELVTQPSATIATVADGDMFFARDDDDSDAVKTATASVVATYIASELSLASSTWTPTVTATLNLDSITTDGGFYIRSGSIVACAATFNYDPTASGEVRFRFTLPVASNLGTSSDLAGVFTAQVGGGFGRVIGDSTNDAAEARINNTVTTSSQGIAVAFYRVI